MEENWFDEVNPEELDNPVKKGEKKPEKAGSILSVIENIQKKNEKKNVVYKSRRTESEAKIDMLEDMPTLEETRQAEEEAREAESDFEEGMMSVPDDFGYDDEDEGYDDGETYIMDSQDDSDKADENDAIEANANNDTESEAVPETDTDTKNESVVKDDPEPDPEDLPSDEQSDDLSEEDFSEEFTVESKRRALSEKTWFKANKRDFVNAVKEENFVSIEVLSGGMVKGDYIGAEETVTICEGATAFGNIEAYTVTVCGTVKGNVTGNVVIVKGSVEGNITAKECILAGHRVILDKETVFESCQLPRT